MSSIWGARSIGSLAIIGVGCTAWSDTEKLRDADDKPLGGILVEIGYREPILLDYGEIKAGTGCRTFRTYNPYKKADNPKAWWTLTEDQVDPVVCEGIEVSRVARAVREMCRVLSGPLGLRAGQRPKSMILTGADMTMLEDACRLARVLMGGGR